MLTLNPDENSTKKSFKKKILYLKWSDANIVFCDVQHKHLC